MLPSERWCASWVPSFSSLESWGGRGRERQRPIEKERERKQSAVSLFSLWFVAQHSQASSNSYITFLPSLQVWVNCDLGLDFPRYTPLKLLEQWWKCRTTYSRKSDFTQLLCFITTNQLIIHYNIQKPQFSTWSQKRWFIKKKERNRNRKSCLENSESRGNPQTKFVCLFVRLTFWHWFLPRASDWHFLSTHTHSNTITWQFFLPILSVSQHAATNKRETDSKSNHKPVF